MKKVLTLAVFLLFALAGFAQTVPTQTFNLTLSPISLPGGKQTVAGTEAGAMITVTPNLDLGNVDVLAPGNNFQYFAGRVNYRIPWLSNKLQNISPTLNGLRFQFGVTASVGVDRITGPGDPTQHYGFTGGGFVNYSIDSGGHYSLGLEAQYAKFPGLNNNTFTVSLDPAIHF